jgi:solute carrier family 12 sodium/potassium/chloride transporter 2
VAKQKKFGAFTGVFTPSVLTILGVIMYMRMGWVVGNAGLVGTIIIVIIAHVISISTGLSVSSIATDKKVGAGGIYYILSRSMGIPIGGAIGIALYVGTALSIALYLIGFAESFNGYFDLDTRINGLRLSGTVALIILTSIALISTSFALKTQFFILAAIVFSLISIFFGASEFALTGGVMMLPDVVRFPEEEFGQFVPLATVFAIYFPAVTGFTAGIAMSGDLQDPKRDIPIGTIAAIALGFVVYIALAIFISFYVNTETLRTDNNILMKIALFAPAVVAGIWGATLSSALGGILGGPRILQAMSIDKITPQVFGKGKGKNNEPVNALLLVFVIAEMGVLIGELDVIARVVSMFYLAAYGFINLSFFLESWANPDFQPTFKVNRWFGLVGFTACFGIMFKLDMIAMFASIIVIMGIYFWLSRKRIMLDSGDVWQSVWGKLVAKGLKRLETSDNTKSNWNPNVILFSGGSEHRPQLLEFSKVVSGRTGIVTDFNLINRKNTSIPLAKTQQTIKDKALENLGIFGRKVEVENIYTGIENIATTFGFSGVEPNTIMMEWPKNIKKPQEYAQMTEKLIHLDYNLLYLDYDIRYEFGKHQTIDLWWRGTDNNNAEMMLNISRFIVQSQKWSNAKTRVLFVNYNNVDNSIIKSKISKLIGKLRIDAEIKIINNGVEQRPFYDIIKLQSANTDLIVLGIPNINVGKQAEFVLKTNDLFETIGTTLLVRASDDFNTLDLDFSQEKRISLIKSTALAALPISNVEVINDLVLELDAHLAETAKKLAEPALSSLSSFYYQFVDNINKDFDHLIIGLKKHQSINTAIPELQSFLTDLIVLSEDFRADKLSGVEELLDKSVRDFILERKIFLEKAPRKVKISAPNLKRWIYWKAILKQYYDTKILTNTQTSFYAFGVQSFISINKLIENIVDVTQLFMENIAANQKTNQESIFDFYTNIKKLLEEKKEGYLLLENQITNDLSTYERNLCIDLVKELEDPDILKKIKKLKKKDLLQLEADTLAFAEDWLRNQTLAHKQMESELNLSISGLSVFNINEKIKLYIKDNIIVPQKNRVKSLLEAVNYASTHLTKKELKDFNNKELDKLASSIAHVNFSNILENDEENILSISRSASKKTDLMSADSFNVLFKCQNDDVESVSINLANIGDYIIQSSYLSPLQRAMEGLELIYNKNSEEIYNLSNLLKHVIEESQNSVDLSNISTEINAVQTRVDTCLNVLETNSLSFEHDINTNLHNTVMDLRIRTILESIDTFAGVSQNPIIKNRFQDWYSRKKKSTTKIYNNTVDFIVQRKQDIDALKFEEKHDQYLNSIEQASDFIYALTIKPGVEEELPFYYKKLFTGSHLGNVNSLNREKELTIAQNAINRIDEGVAGAIIVIGEAMSGKTFFTETVAKALLKVEKYYINPPSKQKFNKDDIHAAFRKTFNKKGTAESILNQLDGKSVLIFNDIEEWWVKGPNGSLVIDYLAKMIESIGNRHYFLLNCNIQSFHIIRKTSKLEKSLLSTIIMSPASKSELKEIIMNRHKTAGAELWYKDNLIDRVKKIDVLLSDIHYKSKGNIGVALNSWIYNINKGEDGKLVVTNPKGLIFPNIKDTNWKIILYHLLIHNRLKDEDISRIFGGNGNKWVWTALNEMEKSGLIYKRSYNTFILNNHAKHYVENWLKELKVLN